MTLNYAGYSRNFLSKKGDKRSQTIGNKHINLMVELSERFQLYNPSNYKGLFGGLGFDGEQLYKFTMQGEPKALKSKPEENVMYNVKVHVHKAGQLRKIKKPCDLELFLLNNAFKKIE